MAWIESARTWWTQKNCAHRQTATRTWFDDGSVNRETVCMGCAKRVPCPPIDDNILGRLLEEAQAAKSKTIV